MNDSNHKHYHVMIPNELHEQIEAWRWQNRKTKTEAVIILLQAGLKAIGKKEK